MPWGHSSEAKLYLNLVFSRDEDVLNIYGTYPHLQIIIFENETFFIFTRSFCKSIDLLLYLLIQIHLALESFFTSEGKTKLQRCYTSEEKCTHILSRSRGYDLRTRNCKYAWMCHSSILVFQVVAGGSGEYEVVYNLPKEGRYKMWIRIYDQDIKDSPFQV